MVRAYMEPAAIERCKHTLVCYTTHVHTGLTEHVSYILPFMQVCFLGSGDDSVGKTRSCAGYREFDSASKLARKLCVHELTGPPGITTHLCNYTQCRMECD